MCDELEEFERQATSTLLEARRIRRSKDVSVWEDGQLCRESLGRVDDVIKHLLVGHGGKPCPAGKRPIVQLAPARERAARKV